MALKSKEWFYKQCLQEIKGFNPLTHLAWRILEIGVGQLHGTRGHATQAIGAIQGFQDAYPQHNATIIASDATRAFDLTAAANQGILADWLTWFAQQHGEYRGVGGQDFGYNFDTLRGYLTPTLGGTRSGGGGGDDEFKTVLRLMPEFIGRP